MTTEKGEPLNEMQVAQATWSRISKLSKHRIMDEMKSCNNIKLGDVDIRNYLLKSLPMRILSLLKIQMDQ